MTTKSKVAYLSKYTTLSSSSAADHHDDDDAKRRRHHQKKKTKKVSRGEQNDANGWMDDIDDNDNIDIHIKSNGEIDNDLKDEEEEEDAPVVVVNPDNTQPPPSNTPTTPHVPRGQWESEVTSSIVQPGVGVQSGGRDDPLPPRRRRRHDSSSEEEEEEEDDSTRNYTTRSNPHHHHTAHPRRRPRHDSDDDENVRIPSSHSRRKRHDSTSNDDQPHDSSQQQQQQQQRRKRHDSSDSNSSSESSRGSTGGSRERMSSGHAAGIQTTSDFTRRESKLQQRKRDETNEFVRQHGGGAVETIYRDRASGQKLKDPQQQHHRDHRNQRVLTGEEQRILNTGRVQLEHEAQTKLEFQKLQASQFARHGDDSELDVILKSKIHADDPMAAYALKQTAATPTASRSDAAAATTHPRSYQGPPPKPNRYQIPPGYRWDARDRGNGFEDLLLAKQYRTNHEAEQAYRYSSADM